jgi:hypothetical protein
MSSYYPLQIGNVWHYRMKDGATYSNLVHDMSDASFAMVNSMTSTVSTVVKEGDTFLTDAFEHGNFQPFLRESLKPGDEWNAIFTANTIKSILAFTVKEILPTKEVEGKQYSHVAVLEAESKMEINGTVMPLNFSTQYFYAQGVGLILTTSSFGDYQALVGYTLH